MTTIASAIWAAARSRWCCRLRTTEGERDGVARDPACSAKKFEIEGHTMRVSFKSGIARYAGLGEDSNTLVQRAEAALKQAKASGEQYLRYQIQMHSELAEQLSLEHRLRAALDEEQFVLYLPAAGERRGPD